MNTDRKGNDPQGPARPEYFGGRKVVLTKVAERIAIARQHKKSGGILIYGHRGVGKTSLIDKIINEVSGTEDAPSERVKCFMSLAGKSARQTRRLRPQHQKPSFTLSPIFGAYASKPSSSSCSLSEPVLSASPCTHNTFSGFAIFIYL